jgi:drug/metabolite transporter (DMT)-like permease
MYYGIILLSVFMFGGCFALKDVYRGMRGSSFLISMESSAVGAFAGLVVLLCINGFQFQLTPFTLLMAFLCAVNGVCFSYFSFKALDYINLSVFSLFSMLGGMLLPSAVGILFFKEEITVAKIVCYCFILGALLMTLSKGKKGGWIWYAGVFALNGMSGVLSKIFASAPFEKTNAAGYSIWSALLTGVLSAIIWLALFRKTSGEGKMPYSLKAFGVASVSGATNKIANFLLVLALAHVDASVQYPMVTGGVMIVSTLICFFGPRKPSKKEIASIAIAFLGMLALFIIPV